MKETTIKALIEACEAAVRYDESIAGKAVRGEVDLTESGGVATGSDLDTLYMDWIHKSREALRLVKEDVQ